MIRGKINLLNFFASRATTEAPSDRVKNESANWSSPNCIL